MQDKFNLRFARNKVKKNCIQNKNVLLKNLTNMYDLNQNYVCKQKSGKVTILYIIKFIKRIKVYLLPLVKLHSPV